jgi:hypothetical protein
MRESESVKLLIAKDGIDGSKGGVKMYRLKPWSRSDLFTEGRAAYSCDSDKPMQLGLIY